MKLVVTTVGKDRTGIVALVSGILAKNNVNILNLSQNIMDGFFNMIMIAELPDAQKNSLREIQKTLADEGREYGVEIRVQHQEIFNVMHNI